MVQAVNNMVKHEPRFILEIFDNGFGSLAMRACAYLRSRRVFNLKGLIKKDKVEIVKALGANGNMSGSRVGVVWMKVGGGIVRARVVSRVVLGLVMKVVLMVLRGWGLFVRRFWMGELSLEEMLMKSVRGIFFGGFWVEELALEAIETLLLRWVEVGSCKEWVQECSCSRDHSPPLGEELEKAIRMTRCLEELELGDEAFFPYP
ncbi:hypothetical protein Tco_1011357 [Tanacetum coccineum]